MPPQQESTGRTPTIDQPQPLLALTPMEVDTGTPEAPTTDGSRENPQDVEMGYALSSLVGGRNNVSSLSAYHISWPSLLRKQSHIDLHQVAALAPTGATAHRDLLCLRKPHDKEIGQSSNLACSK